MKYLVSIMICLQSGLAIATCLSAEAGAKKLFEQEFSGSGKSLEVSILSSKSGDLYLVKDPTTCGMKNCELILAHADDHKCLVTSYSGNGRVRAVKKDDYSEIIFESTNLAVDTKKSTSKILHLNAKTNLFEEKVTK